MMRSMFSGVSGLRIHQTKMDVIANNIANVNTVGYKSSRVTFTEIFNQTLSGASGANADSGRGGVNPMQIGLGSSVSSIDKLMSTGASQRTDAPLDLMISGDAFFIVGDDSGTFFTKAGAFKLDNDGNLAMPNGLKVLGWDAQVVDGEYKITQGVAQPIMITGDKEYVIPEATSIEAASGNLNADTKPEMPGTMDFYDTVGNRYTLDVQYEYIPAAGADTVGGWAFKVGDLAYLNGNRKNAFKINVNPSVTGQPVVTFENKITGTMPDVVNYKPVGGLFFNESGTLDTIGYVTDYDETEDPTTGVISYTYNISKPTPTATSSSKLDRFDLNIYPGPGGSPTTDPTTNVLTPEADLGNNNKITMNFSSITQFGNETANATITKKNGNPPGRLDDISVGPDGIITGRYSNGDTRPLGQIAVARFANPEGLQKIGDNLFVTTANSGDFDGIGEEVQKGEQRILGGVLEMSNVDLASEFTEMITTQRGFQANSRVITTSDDMLQELVNLKR